MQQTENLKLNLIETGDPISPAPLNENAQKLEAALAAETAARADADAALAQADAALSGRVTALEAHKVVFGTYNGNGSKSQTISLGFTPKAVLVYSSYYCTLNALVTEALDAHYGGELVGEIVDGGFRMYSVSGYRLTDSHPHMFIAFT